MTPLSTHSLAPVGWRMELGQEWLSSRVRNLLVFPSGMCLLGGRRWRERSRRSQTLILLCPEAPCDLVNPFVFSGPPFLHLQWGSAWPSHPSSSRGFLGLHLSWLQLSQASSVSPAPARNNGPDRASHSSAPNPVPGGSTLDYFQPLEMESEKDFPLLVQWLHWTIVQQ